MEPLKSLSPDVNDASKSLLKAELSTLRSSQGGTSDPPASMDDLNEKRKDAWPKKDECECSCEVCRDERDEGPDKELTSPY